MREKTNGADRGDVGGCIRDEHPRAAIPLPMLQMFVSVVQRHWRDFLSLEAGVCHARYVPWIEAKCFVGCPHVSRLRGRYMMRTEQRHYCWSLEKGCETCALNEA